MTAADKLRELLATRPTGASLDDLLRWWASAPLVTEVLADLTAMTAARNQAVEIAENMHHALTNGLCRRCEDSVRVCDLETIDALRSVGGA